MYIFNAFSQLKVLFIQTFWKFLPLVVLWIPHFFRILGGLWKYNRWNLEFVFAYLLFFHSCFQASKTFIIPFSVLFKVSSSEKTLYWLDKFIEIRNVMYTTSKNRLKWLNQIGVLFLSDSCSTRAIGKIKKVSSVEILQNKKKSNFIIKVKFEYPKNNFLLHLCWLLLSKNYISDRLF